MFEDNEDADYEFEDSMERFLENFVEEEPEIPPTSKIQNLEDAIQEAVKNGMSNEERFFLVPFFETDPDIKFTWYLFKPETKIGSEGITAYHKFKFSYGLTTYSTDIPNGEQWAGAWDFEGFVLNRRLADKAEQEQLSMEREYIEFHFSEIFSMR